MMPNKIHMHDQVTNKVNEIMCHYKRKPVEQIVFILKNFIKHPSTI